MKGGFDLTLILIFSFIAIILLTAVISFMVFNKAMEVMLPPMIGKLENSDEKIADAMEYFDLIDVGNDK